MQFHECYAMAFRDMHCGAILHGQVAWGCWKGTAPPIMQACAQPLSPLRTFRPPPRPPDPLPRPEPEGPAPSLSAMPAARAASDRGGASTPLSTAFALSDLLEIRLKQLFVSCYCVNRRAMGVPTDLLRKAFQKRRALSINRSAPATPMSTIVGHTEIGEPWVGAQAKKCAQSTLLCGCSDQTECLQSLIYSSRFALAPPTYIS